MADGTVSGLTALSILTRRYLVKAKKPLVLG